MQRESPPDGDDLQAYYRRRAAEYDRVYAKPERQPDLRAIEAWLPALYAGASVVEVACGTGYWTQWLARSARRIAAVDSAPQTLAIARSRVSEGAVRFVVGDAYRLPFDDASFDAAFAGFWYSHVPRKRVQAFLGELHRVLRPGALVVILDNRYVEGSSTPLAERDAEGDTYQLRRLEDGSTHRVLKNFPPQDELRERLAAHTDELRWHEWPYYWAVEYTLRAGPRGT